MTGPTDGMVDLPIADDDAGRDDDDDDYYLMPEEAFVTPECCPTIKQYRAVVLKMPAAWQDGDTATPPTWSVLRHTTPWKLETDRLPPPLYCPFCGKTLPKVVPVVPPRPVCSPTAGGGYCGTCDRRFRECRCLPPERAWGPAPATL